MAFPVTYLCLKNINTKSLVQINTFLIPAPKAKAGKDQIIKVESTMLTFSRYLYFV